MEVYKTNCYIDVTERFNNGTHPFYGPQHILAPHWFAKIVANIPVAFKRVEGAFKAREAFVSAMENLARSVNPFRFEFRIR